MSTRSSRGLLTLAAFAGALVGAAVPCLAAGIQGMPPVGAPFRLYLDLDHPYGVAVTPDGLRIAVADTGNNRVRILDGSDLTEATDTVQDIQGIQVGSGEVWFTHPHGLAWDAAGRLLVTDTVAGEVDRFEEHGSGNWVPDDSWGCSASAFAQDASIGALTYPRDVTVGEDGTVYLVDSGFNGVHGTGRVLRFDEGCANIQQLDLTIVATQGLPDVPGLGDPHGIALGPALAGTEQTLLVADTDHHRALIELSDDALMIPVGYYGESHGMFRRPRGIAADRVAKTDDDGQPRFHIYVADTANSRIEVLDQDGRALWRLGYPPLLASPVAVAVDDQERVYVVDSRRTELLIYGWDMPPPTPYDVWVRDLAGDNGENNVGLPYGVSRSPDLWVRHDRCPPDYHPYTSDCDQHEHPVYDPADPDRPYYIYVRVHNRGTKPVETVNVAVFHADPGTGIPYPDEWHVDGIYLDWDPDSQTGTAGNVRQVGPIETDDYNLRNDHVVEPFVWFPPTPEDPDAELHHCLLVTLDAPEDPLDVPPCEGSVCHPSGFALVRRSNNVALRNVLVERVSVSRGDVTAHSEFDAYGPPADGDGGQSFQQSSAWTGGPGAASPGYGGRGLPAWSAFVGASAGPGAFFALGSTPAFGLQQAISAFRNWLRWLIDYFIRYVVAWIEKRIRLPYRIDLTFDQHGLPPGTWVTVSIPRHVGGVSEVAEADWTWQSMRAVLKPNTTSQLQWVRLPQGDSALVSVDLLFPEVLAPGTYRLVAYESIDGYRLGEITFEYPLDGAPPKPPAIVVP